MFVLLSKTFTKPSKYEIFIFLTLTVFYKQMKLDKSASESISLEMGNGFICVILN